MNDLKIPALSVGSVVKKVLAINPDLSVSDVIALVRGALRSEGTGDTVDEARALELARATLNRPGRDAERG